MEMILVKLLEKLVTEKFIGRMVMLLLEILAKSSKNKIDDGICRGVGDALSEPCKLD